MLAIIDRTTIEPINLSLGHINTHTRPKSIKRSLSHKLEKKLFPGVFFMVTMKKERAHMPIKLFHIL